MTKRKIAILGSTGSIGTQTLDVVRQHRDLFEVSLISARSSADLLIKQALEFDVENVVICDEGRYKYVADALKDKDVKVGNIDRFDFYDEAKKCYCIIQTGETAIYANVILQKGVIK